MNRFSSGERARPEATPLAVLFLSLLATALVTLYVARTNAQLDRARFETAVAETHQRIDQRLQTYVNLLRSTSGLVAANPVITRGEFRRYVDRLDVQRLYPGIQGIGFTERVLPENKARFETEHMLRIWPSEPRSEYHAIVYLEPLDQRNQRAIGFDMMTELARRAAMERARDSGLPAATGRVTLVQEIDAPKQPGFLVYVPIYSGEQAPTSVDERRAKLKGFAYSPFRTEDLIAGIFPGGRPRNLWIEVFDGEKADPRALLHQSAGAREAADRVLFREAKILIAGRPWLVRYYSTPGIRSVSGRRLVIYSLILGLFISGALFILTRALSKARVAAEQTAMELIESRTALQSSETRIRRLVDANLIGIFISDEKGRVVEANEALLKMLGTDATAVTSGKLDIRNLSTSDLKSEEVSRELSQLGTYGPFETTLRRSDGAFVPVLVGLASLEYGAERAVAFVLDLTERKRAEEERSQLLEREKQARAEAEAANRAKDEFLAILSHELRTPMTAILGWSKMLELGDLDPETTSAAVEAIRRSSQAQSQLIEDLLDVSRIAVGKINIEHRVLDLREPVKAAIEAVVPAAETKGVQLIRSLPEEEIVVCGDPSRLQQIVWNLITNAVKFTPEGGKVDVTLEPIDGEARIIVADSGMGIAPEFLPHVFDRFRQADPTSTRSVGGLGLGLSIVKHMVHLHHGTVDVASEGEGKGSEFTVTIPVHARTDGDRPEAEMERGAAADLSGVKVLLVEDDDEVRAFVRVLLMKSLARVTAVPTVDDALRMLGTDTFDVLLSDIAMPRQDGYDLIEKVRASTDQNVRDLPAVALTAYAGEGDQERILRAGFDVYLEKPIEPEELLDAIESVLHKRRVSV
jgi:PAS domain S-box-containing protein